MAKLWNDADLPVYTPQNLTNRQAALQAASGKKQGSLANSLGSVLSGIAKTAGNVAKGVVGTIGGAATNNLITNAIDAKINKKSMAGANLAGKKREEDWQKAIYGGEGGKDTASRILGTNVDAASTLLDFIPGLGAGAKAAINVGQGAMSGFAQEYAENGANADANRAKQGALIGAASGLVGDLAGRGISKLSPDSLIGKAAQSNIGRGALGGAAAGATGGGLAAAMNGGSLSDVLSNAAQGAKGGAVGGATVAGIMGLGGSMLSRGKNNGTTVEPIEPAEAITVNKKRIAPTAEAVAELPEATTTRKGIAVTDYDAGAQDINVRTNKNTKSRGKYIDGVVKGENLPETKVTTAQRFAKEYDTPERGALTIADYVSAGNMGEDGDILTLLKDSISADDYKKLKDSAYFGYELDNVGTDTLYGTSKSALPKINRADYEKVTGYSGKNVEPEMQQFLSKDGRNFNDMAWAQLFPERTKGVGSGSVDITADEILDYYRKVANNDARKVYTTDNIATGLASDPELSNRIMEQVLDFYSPAKKLDIQGGPAVAQQVQVSTPVDTETTYIKRTLPAKQYEQMPQTVAKNTTTELAQATPAEVATTRAKINPADEARLQRQEYVARQRQGEALLSQYGTLDKPTRRAVGDPGEVLNKLYDYGLETPADVQYAANKVTGKDGVVTKMTREIATTAKAVNTALDEAFIDDMIAQNGLVDADAKAVKQQIIGAMKRTGSNGYSDGNTTLDTMKQLEAKIRDYKGTNGTYHNMTAQDKQKVNVLQSVRDELNDRLWASADDITKVVTPERLQELKSMYPENNKWASFVDSSIATAQDGAQLRAAMKPLVDGSKIVDGAKMSAGGVGDTLTGLAKAGSAKGATKNLVGAAADKLLNSDKAKLKRAQKYAAEAETARAQLNGEMPVQAQANGIIGKAKNLASNIADSKAAQAIKTAAGSAWDKLNNETLNNASFAEQTANYGDVIANQIARQSGLKQAEFANNLRELADATAAYDQAASDYIAGQQLVAQERAQAQAMQNQSQLDRIGSAMDLALAAGDINAYQQLADLYQQAYKLDQMRNPQAYATADAKDLSANQSKALAASQQLEALAQMSPDAGTVLSNVPILGKAVELTGGNEYANQAEALATTLGYLLSGANIKESEAKRIGQSYVPTAFDSEAVRQQKLSRARELIQSYLGNTSMLNGNQQAVNSMLGL